MIRARRLAALIAAALLLASPAFGQQPSPPSVTVAKPLQRQVTAWDEFTGQFEAIERVEVRARVSGVVSEVHFRDGQSVQKGDLLFTIDRRPFYIAVEQATAARRSAERMHGLSFPSVVDRGGKVARAFGLRWKLSRELRAAKVECGLDLADMNGESSWTLTMPARFVLSPEGIVEYADISADYTRRGDPTELFPVLSRIRARLAHWSSALANSGFQKACPLVQGRPTRVSSRRHQRQRGFRSIETLGHVLRTLELRG